MWLKLNGTLRQKKTAGVGRENKGTLILNYPDSSGLGLHQQDLCLDPYFALVIEAPFGGIARNFITHPPTPLPSVVLTDGEEGNNSVKLGPFIQHSCFSS